MAQTVAPMLGSKILFSEERHDAGRGMNAVVVGELG
jgi:hypothetical protein